MQAIRQKVKQTLGWRHVQSALSQTDTSNCHFWGLVRPRNFDEMTLLLALYKDITNISYSKLLEQVRSTYSVQKEALEHNIQRARLALRTWAMSIMRPDDVKTIERRGKICHLRFPVWLQTVSLWVDTSDFPRRSEPNMSRKSPRWSHKLNAAGMKWLFIFDAKRSPQFVEGPFFPKVGHSFVLGSTICYRSMMGTV